MARQERQALPVQFLTTSRSWAASRSSASRSPRPKSAFDASGLAPAISARRSSLVETLDRVVVRDEHGIALRRRVRGLRARNEDRSEDGLRGRGGLEGRPDLAIEIVSPSSRRYDFARDVDPAVMDIGIHIVDFMVPGAPASTARKRA